MTGKERKVIRYISMLKGGKKKAYEVILDPVPHVVKDMNISLRGWYKSKKERKNVRPRPCYSEHLLTVPYSGFCNGGCVWCYVNFGTRGWRSTGLSVVDPNYPEKVKKQLSKLHVAFPFYISSFTEPFSKLENVYHVTERLSQVAVDNNLPILYCTRKVVPDWAVALLKKNEYSYVQWSINIIDEKMWKLLAPGVSGVKDLLKNMKKLSDCGIYTTVQCNPIIPGVMNREELKKLILTVRDHGCKHIIFKFIEIVYSNKKELIKKLRVRVHDDKKMKIFTSLFTQHIGGVVTINQEYRKRMLNELKPFVEKSGMTMSLCYEYEYTSSSKTGVSMASKYTSSGVQCHGRMLPIFYRNSLDDMFIPLEGCHGACLYCAEEGSKICRNNTLLSAKALVYKDLLNLKIGGEDREIIKGATKGKLPFFDKE